MCSPNGLPLPIDDVLWYLSRSSEAPRALPFPACFVVPAIKGICKVSAMSLFLRSVAKQPLLHVFCGQILVVPNGLSSREN